LVGVVLAMIVAASCQNETSPEGVFFPKLSARPDDPVLLAKATGTLTIDRGCVWLVAASEQYLLLWPSTYRLVSRDSRIVVLDESGTELASAGERVAALGGELRASPDAPGHIDSWVQSRINTVVPGECRRGLYWQLAGLERG
jgi:hypothetical protein